MNHNEMQATVAAWVDNIKTSLPGIDIVVAGGLQHELGHEGVVASDVAASSAN
jgi:hypothetical protein